MPSQPHSFKIFDQDGNELFLGLLTSYCTSYSRYGASDITFKGMIRSVAAVPKTVELSIKIPKDPKCECGAEKLGHPDHSTWCPRSNPK